jgi:hypothetical protein
VSDKLEASYGLVWTGKTVAGAPFFIAVGHGLRWAYGYTYMAGARSGGALLDTDARPIATLREGLVISDVIDSPQWVTIFGGRDQDTKLPQLPKEVGPGAAADVTGDRLFVVSRSGAVAELDHPSSWPAITYHHVPLNGRRSMPPGPDADGSPCGARTGWA